MSEIPPPPGGGYTPPPAPAGGAPASSDRTMMVALSYLWILALIPLLMKKEDKEVQWHAKNGLAILGDEPRRLEGRVMVEDRGLELLEGLTGVEAELVEQSGAGVAVCGECVCLAT